MARELQTTRAPLNIILSSRVVLVADHSDRWTIAAMQRLGDLGFRCVCVRRLDAALELLRRGGHADASSAAGAT
jgi:hypothetical protein